MIRRVGEARRSTEVVGFLCGRNFMTMGDSTGAPPVRKLSVASLLSLICGVLGCVPFVMGGLAVLLGIVGIARTGNRVRKGRWMAVVGLVLGLASIGGWTLFGGGIWALMKATEGPRVAVHDFIKALSEDDMAKAKSLAPAMAEDEIKREGEVVRSQGKFVDTFFTSSSVNEGGSGHLEGTADFSDGKLHVKADLDNGASGWKVTSIEIVP